MIRLETEAGKEAHVAADRHEMAFVTGAVIGAVAGAAYGLLNVPQAGWRTRSDLSGYAEELGDRLARRITAITAEVGGLFGEDPGDPDVLPPMPGPDDTLGFESMTVNPGAARSEGVNT
jgi:hypothetical protein